MKLFHGTTLNRFKKALEQDSIGTCDFKNKVWDCSHNNTTYFYTENFLKEEQEDFWFNFGVQMALESGDIALSTERKNLKRVVLVFDSGDLEKIGELTVDYSARNMEHCLQFHGKIPISLIKKIFVDRVEKDMFLLYYVGLAQSLSQNSQYVNFCTLDDEMLEASEKVYEALCYYYIENFDYFNEDIIKETSIEELRR